MPADQACIFPLAGGGVLFDSKIERLAVLNATGKIVWELLCEGLDERGIACAFMQHFNLPADAVRANISNVTGELKRAGFFSSLTPRICKESLKPGNFVGSLAVEAGQKTNLGTFQFGDRRVEMHSHLAEVGPEYFARFWHRAVENAGADLLVFSAGPCGYRLKFRDQVFDTGSLAELIAHAHELILSWEHAEAEFLAYFHAAAVSRGEYSILLPGVSGTGKSTLAAYLVGKGFDYLGDDCIALARLHRSLRPLPTCLSLKTGSWPILATLYPELPNLPIVNCHGRFSRYVQPRQARQAGGERTIILFPSYAKSNTTRVTPLQTLETLARLIGIGTDLHSPTTRAMLAEFLKFIEQTPAYELVYSDLACAKSVIEQQLDRTA